MIELFIFIVVSFLNLSVFYNIEIWKDAKYLFDQHMSLYLHIYCNFYALHAKRMFTTFDSAFLEKT